VATELADSGGLEAVTMRRVAEELGVEAMSLYHHTPNKDAVLSGMVDVVFAEVLLEADSVAPGAWQATLRARILAARRVMLRHPWAPQVVESRPGPGLQMARWVDAVVGVLKRGGFSNDTIHHAMHALGSRQFGFVQEIGDGSGGPPADMEAMAPLIPNLVEMLMDVSHGDPSTTLGWCDDQEEFEFGLDLMLDGLERVRSSAVGGVVQDL
jgi:AcrR family transcriptional regulator